MIAWSFVEAVRIVNRTGRTVAALPLAVVQIPLFGLLFYQIAAHLGAEHYRLEQAPHWWDWLLFVIVHVVRAGDLVDFIEAYGLNLQTIHHASPLVAICLMAFHLVLNLFLIRLLMDVIDEVKKRLLQSDHKLRVYVAMAGMAGGFLLIWAVSAGFVRPWRGRDMALWWLDNFLRVLDFVDAMELFHVKLHDVPPALWESTLTLICRLFIGLALNELFSRASRLLSLRLMGGFGLTEGDLRETAQNSSGFPETLRSIARQRLKSVVPPNSSDASTRWTWFGIGSLAVAAVWSVCALVVPLPAKAASQLAATAVQPDHLQQKRALAGLRRLGPHASAMVPMLRYAIPNLDEERSGEIMILLGFLGPDGQAALGDIARSEEPLRAIQAVSALKARGAPAAPHLIRGLRSRNELVRRATHDAIVAQGKSVMPWLVDTVGPENVIPYYDMFEAIDPKYWFLRESPNSNFASVKQVRELMPNLNAEKDEDREKTVAKLGSIGPMAQPALAKLLSLWELSNRRNEVLDKAILRIIAPGRHALPLLMQLIEKNRPPFSNRAAECLGEMGSDAREAVPLLIARAGTFGQRKDGDPYAHALQRIGPPGAESVPALIPILADSNPVRREAALAALQQADPKWRQSASAVVAVQTFRNELAQKNDYRSRQVVPALGLFGPSASAAIPALIDLLPVDEEMCQLATSSLDQIDSTWPKRQEAQRLVAALAAKSGHSDAGFLLLAFKRIVAVSADIPGSLQTLLASESGELRLLAIQTALTHRVASRQHSAMLVPLLDDPWHPTALAALNGLDHIDPDWANQIGASDVGLAVARKYINDYVPGNAQTDEQLRRHQILIRIAGANKLLIPRLIPLLAPGPETSYPDRVKKLLGELPALPADAVPLLLPLLTNRDSEVRAHALHFLNKADANWRQSPEIIKHSQKWTIELEAAKDDSTTEILADALEQLGPAGQASAPALIRRLLSHPIVVGKTLNRVNPGWQSSTPAKELLIQIQKESNLIRSTPDLNDTGRARAQKLLQTLAAFGPEAKESTALLIALLGHSELKIRISSAEALAAIGPDARKAAPNLSQRLVVLSNVATLEGVIEEILAMLTALRNTGSATTTTIAIFSAYLGHGDENVKLLAIGALGKCGPAAKGSLPALKSIAKNGNPPVSTAAEEAIKRIEAKP
jgi:HEAT repeat protein